MNEFGVETLDADDVVHELIPDPEERRRIAAEVFADPEKRKELEARLHPVVKERIQKWFDEKDNDVRDMSDAGDEGLSSLTPPNFQLSTFNFQPSSPNFQPSPPNFQLSTFNFQLRVAIIPLLFEAHWEKNFDIICCVVSSREKQIERMTTTRGMTSAEAEARLAAQLPVEEKARRSHYVIHNDGTVDELRAEAQKLVDALCASASLR